MFTGFDRILQSIFYDRQKIHDGWNILPDGKEIYYVGAPPGSMEAARQSIPFPLPDRFWTFTLYPMPRTPNLKKPSFR